MATNVQRWQAICDALLNKTATAGQADRLAKSLCEQDGMGAQYTAGTNEVKAGLALARIRNYAINTVKSTEASAAASVAAIAATATTDNDFREG